MIEAETDTGQPVNVRISPILQAILGAGVILTTTAIIWVAAAIVEHDARIAVLEAMDREEYVSVREFDSHVSAVSTQLTRILTILDEMRR